MFDWNQADLGKKMERVKGLLTSAVSCAVSEGEIVLQSVAFWCLLLILEVTKEFLLSVCCMGQKTHPGESGLLK